MFTVMLLDGEGEPADLEGARAAYDKLLKERGGHPDADGEALGPGAGSRTPTAS